MDYLAHYKLMDYITLVLPSHTLKASSPSDTKVSKNFDLQIFFTIFAL